MPPLRLVAAATLAALALWSPASASAQGPPYDDAGYWAFADRMQQRLDRRWDEDAGYYRCGGSGTGPMFNSMLLLTHSVAALEGHDGPARNDLRARALAARLVAGPPYVKRNTGSGQTHAPGWVNSMTLATGDQHLVFDAEVVDGLVYAYRARRELDLPDSTVSAIRAAIRRTARSRFWRYPTIRLNQFNWYALMYAADATVTGDPALLRRDLRLQLLRFVRGARAGAAGVGNFGPGMRFHYLPHMDLNHPMNVDSAEYSNIVLSFTRFYTQARRAGMAPLPTAHKRLVGEWIERALAGYWTHGGYMNWDSGLGFERWHQAKKLGLTQQALVGIASTPSLAPGARWGRWAKYMLDRGMELYERTAERDGGIADALFFDVHAAGQEGGSARLAAARIQANAARAIAAGLGRRRASRPPALYAYDPDIGRLAVTTPAYNTAIVAVNQRAFPYGGLDLARLFDGRQEVAGGIGGTPPASFGALVRDTSGRRVLASQVGRAQVNRRVTPLRLTRAPLGAGASASSAVGRAFAAPFRVLRATGSVTGATAAIRVSHRFTPAAIQTRWDVTRRGRAAPYSVDVLFPSTGRRGARVLALLRDGSRVRVRDRRLPLARVRRLEVRSRHGGYTVTPLNRPAGATVHVLRPAPQPSAPDAGPTLAVQLERAARFTRTALSVRIRLSDD
jgi:hypothetical protein